MLSQYINKGKERATAEGINYARNNPDQVIQAAQMGGGMM
jgi:hypothetical protein